MRHYNPDDRIELTEKGRLHQTDRQHVGNDQALTGQQIHNTYRQIRLRITGRAGASWESISTTRQDMLNILAIELNKQLAQAIIEAKPAV